MNQNGKKDTIDILVLTYQRKHYMQEWLEQFYIRTEYPFRLIVMDNGSTDGTREWLLKMKKIGLVDEIIFNKENLPMAQAFTEGIKYIKSELFVVSQDDLIPPMVNPCWLTQLVKEKLENEEYATISLRCKNRSWKRWINSEKAGFEEMLNPEKKELLSVIKKKIYGC